MSKADVEAVFGPQWVQDVRDCERAQARITEQVVRKLREMLREYDPSLPHPLDGPGWWELEKEGVDGLLVSTYEAAYAKAIQ